MLAEIIGIAIQLNSWSKAITVTLVSSHARETDHTVPTVYS